ncbi:MAG TPA: hypothetical protein VGR50_06860 [Terriglobales bacterium]|nr:hypothetical protein [Terriglobales bacterium]
MAGSRVSSRPSLHAAELRRELSHRNVEYSRRLRLEHRISYGDPPVVCYLPSEEAASHGNFLPQTYRAMLLHENWRKRLNKVHAQAVGSLPKEDRRWRELDSANSSDALLMNIFCFPGTLREPRLFDLLGVERGASPEFGVKARIPLANGRFDRTEIDMHLGSLLVEAKLTESDFQSREAAALDAYRDFHDVFDSRSLPQAVTLSAAKDPCISYLGYQLIRNVLAAHANACSFCLMADARRPDLKEAWYAVMRSVQIVDLRLRCKMITWQELAEVLPRKLQRFLAEKYGIAASTADDLRAVNL